MMARIRVCIVSAALAVAAGSASVRGEADPPLPRARPAPLAPGVVLTIGDIREIVMREAPLQGLDPALVDAVIKVESNYRAGTVGTVGEIGLMQVRPSTARLLGFSGTDRELADPETNIRLGVKYLAKAWSLANGDLCRALMKYRAGHGEEVMSPLSVEYCRRARDHLATRGLDLEEGKVAVMDAATLAEKAKLAGPATPLRGKAFWAAQRERVRALTTEVRQRWAQMAKASPGRN